MKKEKKQNFVLSSSRSVSVRDIMPFLFRTTTLQRDGKGVRGFTLIELLVVVLIIGILAAVALPQYEKAVMKARMVQTVVDLDALAKAQSLYFLANGTYATSLDEVGIEIKGSSCHFSGSAVNCYFAPHQRILALLQYDLTTKKHLCCTYPDSNYKWDNLCATQMNNPTWTNGCSSEYVCHCFTQR